MSSFDEAVSFVLNNEGRYSNNPRDKGSATNYGISLRFLNSLPIETIRGYGFGGVLDDQAIRDMTLETAKKIYREQFWSVQPFFKILKQEHANYIFDFAVNCGIAPAIKAVQRACWAVLRKPYSPIDDGILGDGTLAAINQCGYFLMPAMRAERGSYYRDLVQRFPEQKEFLHGWYDRCYST